MAKRYTDYYKNGIIVFLSTDINIFTETLCYFELLDLTNYEKNKIQKNSTKDKL